MGSKISNIEWGLVIGAVLTIDIVEWLLDFFVIGPFVNWIIDIFIGLSLPLYFYLRGVKPNGKKVATWILAYFGETISLDGLWIIDVVLTMAWDKVDKGIITKVPGGSAAASMIGGKKPSVDATK